MDFLLSQRIDHQQVPFLSLYAEMRFNNQMMGNRPLLTDRPVMSMLQTLQALKEESARIAAFRDDAPCNPPPPLQGEQTPFVLTTRQIMQDFVGMRSRAADKSERKKVCQYVAIGKNMDRFVQNQDTEEQAVLARPTTWDIFAVLPYNLVPVGKGFDLSYVCRAMYSYERADLPRYREQQALENSYSLHYSHWLDQKAAPYVRISPPPTPL